MAWNRGGETGYHLQTDVSDFQILFFLLHAHLYFSHSHSWLLTLYQTSLGNWHNQRHCSFSYHQACKIQCVAIFFFPSFCYKRKRWLYLIKGQLLYLYSGSLSYLLSQGCIESTISASFLDHFHYHKNILNIQKR